MGKINLYKKLGEAVISIDHGMTKQYMPKVKVCQQIMSLSASVISQCFDGVQGKHYIEGIRHVMIEELSSCPVPVSGWRDIATRLKARRDTGELE